MVYARFFTGAAIGTVLVFGGWADSLSVRMTDRSSHLSGRIDGMPVSSRSGISGNTIRTHGTVGGSSFSDTTSISDDFKMIREAGNIGDSHYSLVSHDLGHDTVHAAGSVGGESVADVTRIVDNAIRSSGHIGNKAYYFTARDVGANSVCINGNFGGEHFNETIHIPDDNTPSVNICMPEVKIPEFNASDFNFSDFDLSL